MSLAQLRKQRRASLPPLSPTDDRPEPAATATAPAAAAPGPTPAPAAPSPRPAATSRPAVGGARLDSLLSSLIANAPQVPAEAPRAEPAAASPPLEAAAPPRPARRFPWRLVLGVTGAAVMAVVAVAGVRGVGQRLASPARLPDGSPVAPRPTSNVDAWIAANSNGGPTL